MFVFTTKLQIVRFPLHYPLSRSINPTTIIIKYKIKKIIFSRVCVVGHKHHVPACAVSFSHRPTIFSSFENINCVSAHSSFSHSCLFLFFFFFPFFFPSLLDSDHTTFLGSANRCKHSLQFNFVSHSSHDFISSYFNTQEQGMYVHIFNLFTYSSKQILFFTFQIIIFTKTLALNISQHGSCFIFVQHF